MICNSDAQYSRKGLKLQREKDIAPQTFFKNQFRRTLDWIHLDVFGHGNKPQNNPQKYQQIPWLSG